MSRATLDKRPVEVSRMLDAVAARYDAMNRVMTFGREGRWRRVVDEVVRARPGMRVLDLAAGTGASTKSFAGAGADAVACDFSAGMLAEGRRRHPELTFVAGDAPRLARLLSSDPSSYAYLAESAAGWLGQQDLADVIRGAGWEQVAWQDLTWGVVAVHTAVRAE